jgi:hypothetical protein
MLTLWLCGLDLGRKEIEHLCVPNASLRSCGRRIIKVVKMVGEGIFRCGNPAHTGILAQSSYFVFANLNSKTPNTFLEIEIQGLKLKRA